MLRALARPSWKLCRSSVRTVATSDRDKARSATEAAADRIEEELTRDDVAPLADINQHRRPMPSFMKELFLGRFQSEILSYPDIFDADRYQALRQRCDAVRATLESKRDAVVNIPAEGKVPKDLLLALRSQGFFGLNVPASEGGAGLSMTETCKLMEELSVDMSLSETVGSAATTGYKAVQHYGTEEVKSAHLAKLAQGLEVGAWCVTDSAEGGAGVDAASTKTKALEEEDGHEFSITGKKTWVVNAQIADVFTVFANVASKDQAGVEELKLTAFLVPKSAPGVRVVAEEPLVMSGLKGVSCCPVEFKNVAVPRSHMLGEVGDGFEILADVLSSDRLIACARIASSLKRLLDATVRHTLGRKTFGKRMIEFDLVQNRLSECSVYLYALESMIYMTAGIADHQTDVDVGMETATTRRLALKAAKIICENCTVLQGGKAYLEDDPSRRLGLDLNAYEMWDSTDDILAMYVAVSGISVAGAEMQQKVTETRNPLAHPYNSLRNSMRMFRVMHLQKDYLPFDVAGSVHPSLSMEGSIVEGLTTKFGMAVYRRLLDGGSNCVGLEVDLQKMADITMVLYAMACCLGRASRSYCDGHEHGTLEVMLARGYVHSTHEPALVKVNKLLRWAHDNHESVYQAVGYQLQHQGRYPVAHPTTKNVF